MELTRRAALRLMVSIARLSAAAALLGSKRHARAAALEPGAAVGPLEARVEQTLLSALHSVTHEKIELEHYQQFFRWRSEHLPGYRQMYVQFANLLEAIARKRDGLAFVGRPAADRRALLDSATSDSTTLQLRARVLGEALVLFAMTDAWLELGYDSWPGTARGLEAYRSAPLRAAH